MIFDEKKPAQTLLRTTIKFDILYLSLLCAAAALSAVCVSAVCCCVRVCVASFKTETTSYVF